MKILYLQPAEAFGGAERQGVLHIRHLPDHGIDVVPVVGPGLPIVRALADAGVSRHVFFPHFPAATHRKMSAAGNLRHATEWMRAVRRSVDAFTHLAAVEAPDLIVANRTVGWAIAAPVSRRLGIPWVARAGSRPVHPLAPLGLLGLQLSFAPPVALLANCDAVRRDLEPWFHAPAFDLPNAVDVRRFDPARAPADRPAPLVVGIAARPAPEKGLGFLLEAVAEINRRVPEAVFLWAGAFGWQAHFEEQARRAGLGQALRFLGHVDDVAGFYAACDVVVLTSRRRSIEGSPNALLEAMAMERPVVATAVGGVPEIVRSGVEGILVGDRDVAGFVDAIETLLRQPLLRRRLGTAGRRRILERHAVPRVVGQLADILRSLVPSVERVARGAA